MGDRADTVTMPARRLFALRAVAGPYRGAVIPLEPDRALVIGRSAEADLVLDEQLMSRHHARITWEEGAPVVQDLRSTNGTFVNGLRVERWRLAQDDRVHLGANILKLVAEFVPVGLAEARAQHLAEDAPDAAVQGRLEEIPLADLLQLLGATRKSGVLTLRRGADVAEIHLQQGGVVACALRGRRKEATKAALRRLLGWTEGAFALDPLTVPAEGEPERVEALLLEALRELDETARPRDAWPAHTPAPIAK